MSTGATIAGVDRVAVLGAGVIGASWTALFLAAGLAVEVYDADPGAPDKVRRYVDRAWPALVRLGLADREPADAVRFHATAEAAVADVGFVQENVPERLPIKLDLFRRIEPALPAGALVASSASGLMVTEMQAGWQDPSRFLLGHPFNPPHLIPLVEVLGNARTDPAALAAAEAFYAGVGKVTIRVRREVPGHVANRLQAALWREAIHLVAEGVASVEDVDRAVWAGPGLRWAAMGPHMLFHLGAGDGGLAAFCERYADSFHRWWDGLGDPRLTADVRQALVDGVAAEQAALGGADTQDLSTRRDAMIVAMLDALRATR